MTGSRKKGKRAIGIARVSSDEQGRKGTSLHTQIEWIQKTAKSRSLSLIKIIKETISGEDFPKKYGQEILNLVKDKGVSYLLIHSIDRFSRNLPEGAYLLEKLKEMGVRVITNLAEYNLNKPEDRMQVWFGLLFAETEQYYRAERVVRGIFDVLKKGGIPYQPPYGVEIVDGKARIINGYQEIIRQIFTTFIEKKNYEATARLVNELFGDRLNFKLTGNKVKKIVSNPIYLGYILWNGILFGKDGSHDRPWENLRIIDEKTFSKAQSIIKKISGKYSRNEDLFQQIIGNLIDEHGLDVVANILNIKVACSNCDSVEISRNGTEIINGTLTVKFICNNCGHQFRVPSAKKLKKIESLEPLRCMNCGSANKFYKERVSKSMYKIICKECGFFVFMIDEENKEEDSNTSPRAETTPSIQRDLINFFGI